MNLEQYRKERRELLGEQDANKECINILWASNSLAGEVGELANEVKKLFRDDNGELTDERFKKIIDEGGDVLWYLLFFFENILEIPLEKLMVVNMKKLRKRYENKKVL